MNPSDDFADRGIVRSSALADLADAVADGTPVDWPAVESSATSSDERRRIEQFRILWGLMQVQKNAPSVVAADPRQHEPAAPRQVPLTSWGPLKIRETVGSGGFGTVFRAWDPHLEREVALKLLHDIWASHDAGPVVVNEGRLLAQIRHENVVTVFGADCFEGFLGLWMEFVHGRTLRTIVEGEGPFSAQETVLLGLDLCRALAAVHREGFLHRDIKAQNVMREAGGRIVLMDFGAAAVIKSLPEFALSIRGTPLYLAPEVLQGDAPTVQSDLYSVGVLLYYLVSGEFPITGQSLDELRKAHAQQQRRRLRDLRPNLPTSFVRVIDEVIDPVPSRRPRSAGDLEASIEHTAGHGYRRRSEADLRQSIAVLPFSTIGPETNLEYLCDGIAEEIINILTRMPGLRVVAGSSPFRVKNKDVRDVGRDLNVGIVLDGTIRASRNSLRVIARMTNSADGSRMWSQGFDCNSDDVFSIQDQISRGVVGVLRLRVSPEILNNAALPGSPSTRDFDAYTLYLKGRFHWNQRTETSLLKSVAYFDRALVKAPEFAEAHAALAEALATLGCYGAAPPHDVMPKARTAAQTSLDIVETLSNAFTTLGCIEAVYDWSWSSAERRFTHAIDLNPCHPSAHHWYAINYLVPMKRFSEAATELQKAIEADPLSMPIRTSFGLRSYFARRYESALEELRDTFEQDERFAPARLFLGLTLAELATYDDAIRELQAAVELSGRSPETTAALGYAHGRAGNIEHARSTIGELLALSEQRYVSPSLVAQVYAGIRDTGSALQWLEKSCEVRAADLAWLHVRPVFDELRSESRFDALRERVGESSGWHS